MTGIQAITLTELARQVKQAVEDAFTARSFWVIADVTNHTFKAASNYHYFELVEKDRQTSHLVAKFSAKACGEASRRIVLFEQATGQAFRSNIQVLIKVTVNYHAGYGLQLNLTDVDPNFTLGILAQQKEHTLQRLVTDNAGYISLDGSRYVTRNNQLPLNRVIQRLAVIASEISAGLQDFTHTLANNIHGYRFYTDYYYTSVQGDLNAKHLLHQILEVFYSKQQYDAVAIIRGGGSQTDFLIFDNYDIARAVARFPIPVITGIGHQKNETIVDLMAHSPTKTPTQAAEYIISHNLTFQNDLLSFQQSIIIRSQQAIAHQHQSLSWLNASIVNHSRTIISACKTNMARVNQAMISMANNSLSSHRRRLVVFSNRVCTRPSVLTATKKQELAYIAANLKLVSRHYLGNRRNALQHYTAVVSLMSPAHIVRRGFAVIKVNGAIITDADRIAPGSNITVVLSGMEIVAAVISKSKYNGNDIDL